MPTLVDISEEELTEFLGNGGLKPDTLVKRKRHYDEVSTLTTFNLVNSFQCIVVNIKAPPQLYKFVLSETGTPMDGLLVTDEGRKKFSEALSRYVHVAV